MNVHEIYDFLLGGKTLEVDFSTAEEAEAFRIRIAQFKTRQDKKFVELGLLTKDDRQVFATSIQPDLLANKVTMTLRFRDRLVGTQYTVRVVSDGEPGADA